MTIYPPALAEQLQDPLGLPVDDRTRPAAYVARPPRTFRMEARQFFMDATPNDAEFAEIGLPNQKIRLLRGEDGKVSLEMKGVGFSRTMQVGVALDGDQLEYWPMTGMCSNPRREPQMVPVLVASDREGFFGRTCPRCSAYFRTEHTPSLLFCPYCGVRADLIRFMTSNQLQFIDKVRADWLLAFQGGEVSDIDLDAITRSLPDNRPAWGYSEERQQHCFTCMQCENRFDILGEYGRCPQCGTRNWRQVLAGHLDALQSRLDKAATSLTERAERELEWRQLIGACI